MAHACPNLFSQSNGHHFHDAALIRPPEIGMRLNPAAYNDTVCPSRILVNQYVPSILSTSYFHNIHAGLDGAAHCLLGNPKGTQYGALPLTRGASVAAHGRHNKRIGAFASYKCNNGFR